eukprot:718477-Amphidinium_carterae.2
MCDRQSTMVSWRSSCSEHGHRSGGPVTACVSCRDLQNGEHPSNLVDLVTAPFQSSLCVSEKQQWFQNICEVWLLGILIEIL